MFNTDLSFKVLITRGKLFNIYIIIGYASKMKIILIIINIALSSKRNSYDILLYHYTIL